MCAHAAGSLLLTKTVVQWLVEAFVVMHSFQAMWLLELMLTEHKQLQTDLSCRGYSAKRKPFSTFHFLPYFTVK